MSGSHFYECLGSESFVDMMDKRRVAVAFSISLSREQLVRLSSEGYSSMKFYYVYFRDDERSAEDA